MPSKILFIHNSAKTFKVFRAHFIKHLLAQGYEIVIIVPKDVPDSALLAGVTYRFVGFNQQFSKLYKNIFEIFTLYNGIKNEKPDLVLSYTLVPNILGSFICRSLNIPIINNITGLGSLFVSTSFINPLLKKIFKIGLQKANKVVVLNKSDYTLLEKTHFVDKSKLELLNGEGVDEHQFKMEAFLPLPVKTNFTFLFVGRLLKEKGIIEFLEAAKWLLHNIPNKEFEFNIIGEFDNANRSVINPNLLESIIKEYPSIHYLGYQELIAPYIAAADSVVLPSYREGMPRVLLEAACMQKPLIATYVPGCIDLVMDGVNGFLCEAKNSQALAQQMKKMLELSSKDKETMGIKSRQLILEKFTATHINDAYTKLIKEILN